MSTHFTWINGENVNPPHKWKYKYDKMKVTKVEWDRYFHPNSSHYVTNAHFHPHTTLLFHFKFTFLFDIIPFKTFWLVMVVIFLFDTIPFKPFWIYDRDRRDISYLDWSDFKKEHRGTIGLTKQLEYSWEQIKHNRAPLNYHLDFDCSAHKH
jgi:hypothetical protein